MNKENLQQASSIGCIHVRMASFNENSVFDNISLRREHAGDLQWQAIYIFFEEYR
jgi:hypothetical protein